MGRPHRHGRQTGEQPGTGHPSTGHHADADTHGQAMPHEHAHSAVDEEHAVHTHGEHAGHSTAMFKNKFLLSLVLSIPVLVFSPMVGHLLGYQIPEFAGSAWISPVLGTVIFLHGGMPFLKEAGDCSRGHFPDFGVGSR